MPAESVVTCARNRGLEFTIDATLLSAQTNGDADGDGVSETAFAAKEQQRMNDTNRRPRICRPANWLLFYGLRVVD